MRDGGLATITGRGRKVEKHRGGSEDARRLGKESGMGMDMRA